MNLDIKKSQLRAIQYQHVDGAFELTLGGSMLLMAAGYYLISRVSPPASSLLPFAPLAMFAGGGLLFDYLIRQFRMRVTTPRTGYLTYRKPKPLKRSMRLMIWIGMPLFTLLFLGILFLNRSKFPAENQASALLVIPVFFGLLFSGMWAIIGWKIALPRFYFIAIASLLMSAGLVVSGVGYHLGMAVLVGGMGALLCASGGVTLWKYLRRNPLPEKPSNEQ